MQAMSQMQWAVTRLQARSTLLQIKVTGEKKAIDTFYHSSQLKLCKQRNFSELCKPISSVFMQRWKWAKRLIFPSRFSVVFRELILSQQQFLGKKKKKKRRLNQRVTASILIRKETGDLNLSSLLEVDSLIKFIALKF